MDEGEVTLVAGPEEVGVRLDRFLVSSFPETTRSVLRKWIDGQRVFVDGAKPGKAGMLLTLGMRIQVLVPPASEHTPAGEEIPIAVLHEDDHIIIVNKPAGMVVHPAQAYPGGTLVNALLGRGTRLSGVGERGRPGIVHRLDRDTSGVMVVAKSDVAHHGLATMFADREIDKTYHALVWGSPDPEEDEVRSPIGRCRQNPTRMAVGGIRSRPAITRYRTVSSFPGFSWLEIQLLTGRTHQVRVHMSALNHPVVGDKVYGGVQWKGLQDPARRNLLKKFDRHALHASVLAFNHPVTGERISFTAELPEEMSELLTMMRT
ncbi:MAG: RluA family pseudouridine synthase [Acidobacteria bacterium]|uniref:Pseudouridine synthase n=1 Tax=Candidatus Polarisedimenticola svalbardensis TaxID=2886004 RepID=A0A8J6XZH6_9BACT|nr:RluA family pseudouridine synthase [Candidatus Polarisedimenticola svalbardensis]